MKLEHLGKLQALQLLGVVTLTDGYLQITKDKSRWELETSPNPNLHKICKNLFLKALRIKPNTRVTKDGRFVRTELFGLIYKSSLMRIKRLTKNNFQFLKTTTPKIKILAFRLAMDLEGSISPKFSLKKKKYKQNEYFQFQFDPELKLSFVDKAKINDWIEILKSIGFNFTIQRDTRYESGVGGLRTSGKNQIIQFYKSGGFLTDIKITKSPDKNLKINGFLKQNMLKTVVFILQNHSDYCSKSFDNKNEAESYRRWFIKNLFIPTRNKLK